MTTHVLKTKSAYFDAVASGAKTFEVRVNDRGFQAGDVLRLVRYDKSNGCADPDCKQCFRPPDSLTKVVTFVYAGDPTLRDTGGLVPGHVVMGLGDPA